MFTEKLPFREHHLFQLLHGYEKQQYPLDFFISNYFRENKALGSKDRGYIANTVYSIVRWRSLIDYLNEAPITWEKRFETFKTLNLEASLNDASIPLHIRLSFPLVLFDLLNKDYGEERTRELCLASNQAAPTTVRVNALKTTREKMLARWNALFRILPCEQAEFGINFLEKTNFFNLPEFTEGLFEVQDEGSQLLSDLVKAKPGQLVMDYCAGSGGKTLAFAPKMNGKGQIFLHDIRQRALLEARKRLKRAGIQNAQTILAEDPKLKKLKKSMDWVLVDAPCTGTGTLRRNPDMKWNFNEETLVRLVGQQRMIFEKALSFLKPGGRIIYSTCSILRQENEDQMAHFQKTYQLKVEGQPFQSFPAPGGMDGFFGAVFYQ